MRAHLAALLLTAGLSSCCRCRPEPTPAPASADAPQAADAAVGTVVTIGNATNADTTVFVSFGSNSVILPSSWSSFCTPLTALSCSFPLAATKRRVLPLSGSYLNATFTFGAPVGCGTTKAEVNVNNPSWYDVTDVSLVDGFSNYIMVEANGTRIFAKKSGNEKSFGVYPLGCDICVARQSPPCGISKGTDGCKAGTQYNPAVPCQYQGPTKGGGGKIEVLLVQPEPA